MMKRNKMHRWFNPITPLSYHPPVAHSTSYVSELSCYDLAACGGCFNGALIQVAHPVIYFIHRRQLCIVFPAREKKAVREERVGGSSVLYLVNLIVRKLNVHRVRHQLDVLNGLYADDGEDLCRLVKQVRQCLQ
jgi:hypothetical protein